MVSLRQYTPPAEYELFIRSVAERVGADADLLTPWQLCRAMTLPELGLLAGWLENRLTTAIATGAPWQEIEWARLHLADCKESAWWVRREQERGRRHRNRRAEPPCPQSGHGLRDAA